MRILLIVILTTLFVDFVSGEFLGCNGKLGIKHVKKDMLCKHINMNGKLEKHSYSTNITDIDKFEQLVSYLTVNNITNEIKDFMSICEVGVLYDGILNYSMTWYMTRILIMEYHYMINNLLFERVHEFLDKIDLIDWFDSVLNYLNIRNRNSLGLKLSHRYVYSMMLTTTIPKHIRKRVIPLTFIDLKSINHLMDIMHDNHLSRKSNINFNVMGKNFTICLENNLDVLDIYYYILVNVHVSFATRDEKGRFRFEYVQSDSALSYLKNVIDHFSNELFNNYEFWIGDIDALNDLLHRANMIYFSFHTIADSSGIYGLFKYENGYSKYEFLGKLLHLNKISYKTSNRSELIDVINNSQLHEILNDYNIIMNTVVNNAIKFDSLSSKYYIDIIMMSRIVMIYPYDYDNLSFGMQKANYGTFNKYYGFYFNRLKYYKRLLYEAKLDRITVDIGNTTGFAILNNKSRVNRDISNYRDVNYDNGTINSDVMTGIKVDLNSKGAGKSELIRANDGYTWIYKGKNGRYYNHILRVDEKQVRASVFWRSLKRIQPYPPCLFDLIFGAGEHSFITVPTSILHQISVNIDRNSYNDLRINFGMNTSLKSDILFMDGMDDDGSYRGKNFLLYGTIVTINGVDNKFSGLLDGFCDDSTCINECSKERCHVPVRREFVDHVDKCYSRIDNNCETHDCFILSAKFSDFISEYVTLDKFYYEIDTLHRHMDNVTKIIGIADIKYNLSDMVIRSSQQGADVKLEMTILAKSVNNSIEKIEHMNNIIKNADLPTITHNVSTIIGMNESLVQIAEKLSNAIIKMIELERTINKTISRIDDLPDFGSIDESVGVVKEQLELTNAAMNERKKEHNSLVTFVHKMEETLNNVTQNVTHILNFVNNGTNNINSSILQDIDDIKKKFDSLNLINITDRINKLEPKLESIYTMDELREHFGILVERMIDGSRHSTYPRYFRVPKVGEFNGNKYAFYNEQGELIINSYLTVQITLTHEAKGLLDNYTFRFRGQIMGQMKFCGIEKNGFSILDKAYIIDYTIVETPLGKVFYGSVSDYHYVDMDGLLYITNGNHVMI